MPQRISAYIPVYNNFSTLELALRSIMRQSHPVDELFVVDDGSTDGSAEVAERLGIRVLKQSSNLGRGAARARAMEESRHEFVVCCDATNVLDPNFIAASLHWFDEEGVAAVFGRITQDGGRTIAHRWRGRHLFKIGNNVNCVRQMKLITYGTVVRKSAIMAAGNYDRNCRQAEDRDLGERLLIQNYDVIFDPSLTSTSIAKNSVVQVLERYSRWYGPLVRVSWYDYLRLVYYSIKCMAAQDVKERDLLAVPISLVCPHVQFWRAYFTDTRSLSVPKTNE